MSGRSFNTLATFIINMYCAQCGQILDLHKEVFCCQYRSIVHKGEYEYEKFDVKLEFRAEKCWSSLCVSSSKPKGRQRDFDRALRDFDHVSVIWFENFFLDFEKLFLNSENVFLHLKKNVFDSEKSLLDLS